MWATKTLKAACHAAAKVGPSRLMSTGVDNVGFIGLGNMGGGMAKNLAAKGKSVVVYDANVGAMNEVGLSTASSPAEVAKSSKVIVTMLPNNDIVRKVYLCDKEGILSAVHQGSVLIDSSTVDPAVCKEVSEAAKEKGAVFMDAPVSGGVNAAKAGTLTFMVGAPSEEDFAKAKSILTDMGPNITHCGGVGMGQAVKICNNMLLAVTMIGVSETMNLGISLGLDPKLLAKIMGTATGRCWSVDTYNPVPGVMPNVPSSNNYEGGFGCELMLKDLGLAQDAASRTGTTTPLGAQALHVYRLMCNSGYGGKDFGSAFQFLTKDENKGKRYD